MLRLAVSLLVACVDSSLVDILLTVIILIRFIANRQWIASGDPDVE